MLDKNNFSHRIPTMENANCILERHRKLMYVLLICLAGLLPSQLFSQPLAEGHDKFLGCSSSYYVWRNLDTYWNQVTPGDAGKWGSVEQMQGQYNWTNLDKIYTYATNRNLAFKEHVLVWMSQQPSWIASLDTASQRAAVENWIRNVGQHYPLMSYVDVVNEPFHGAPSYKDALGGDGATGWDWVITAFKMARKYCAPGVKLILNEYNILHDNTVTTNYINLINLLKDRGLIDGIGVQGHYFEFRSHVDATSNKYVYSVSTIKSNLDRLVATGLPVYITEFDVDEANDANQLAQYQIYFPIFWNNPGVKGITFWGYIQDDVWSAHPDTYLLLSNGTERPALQWLRTYIEKAVPPILHSPVGTTGEPRNPLLVWRPSASATSYRVQISTNRTLSTVTLDSTVTDTVLQLSPLAANTTFYWHVSAINQYGAGDYSDITSFKTGDQIVDVKALEGLPTKFELFQNYPNPFNPSTTIMYSIPILETLNATSLHVVMKVYDVLGKMVATLVDEEKSPGNYEARFNGTGLPSGVYFYRLQAGSFSQTKKLLFMK